MMYFKIEIPYIELEVIGCFPIMLRHKPIDFALQPSKLRLSTLISSLVAFKSRA